MFHFEEQKILSKQSKKSLKQELREIVGLTCFACFDYIDWLIDSTSDVFLSIYPLFQKKKRNKGDRKKGDLPSFC